MLKKRYKGIYKIIKNSLNSPFNITKAQKVPQLLVEKQIRHKKYLHKEQRTEYNIQGMKTLKGQPRFRAKGNQGCPHRKNGGKKQKVGAKVGLQL